MAPQAPKDVRIRSWLLWGGFALVCVAAVVTVVLPELADAGEAPPPSPAVSAPDAR